MLSNVRCGVFICICIFLVQMFLCVFVSIFMQNQCFHREFERNGKCLKCHRSCLTCSGPLSDNCLDCYSDTYLLHNSCLSFCPETYYPSGNLCSKCGNYCRTCHGEAFQNISFLNYFLLVMSLLL